MSAPVPSRAEPARAEIAVTGLVQGVGFRPFVAGLARSLDLAGWVQNTQAGVLIAVAGQPDAIASFRCRLRSEAPRHAVIHDVACRPGTAPQAGQQRYGRRFEIRPSDPDARPATFMLPDLATCQRCVAEIGDRQNRRYRHPFISCTQCGPRFSIALALPYDRARTTMAGFAMCDLCRAEYRNPDDRRFHAETIACPACGPELAFCRRSGEITARGQDALGAALACLRRGEIVAVKGLGGFHLLVRACDGAAIGRLRARKHRPDKPLAVMFPSLEAIAAECAISPPESELLASSQAPIVLLRRVRDLRDSGAVAREVAPGLGQLGVLLPYTGLHHLIARDLAQPVVATSGNLSGEPLCIDAGDALARLGGIADGLLLHDRAIARPVDDSVAHVVGGRPQVLRRGRGYAPAPLSLPAGLCRPAPAMALGGHFKAATASAAIHRAICHAILGPHIGDLDDARATRVLESGALSLARAHGTEPEIIACDAHPDYRTSQLAREMAAETGNRLVAVQHHHAHVLACMADNRISGPVLGVAWDGTGYGGDGTIWGGEFLRVGPGGMTRFARLRRFHLPGGDLAARQPRRSALGVLREADLPPPGGFTGAEVAILQTAMARGINAPLTSSAGRLFDAVAAILGLGQISSFEGQAAMALEDAAQRWAEGAAMQTTGPAGPYPYAVCAAPGDGAGEGASPAEVLEVDWTPMVRRIVADVATGAAIGAIALRFHATLAEIICDMAIRSGDRRIVLSGGCFQNRLLSEKAIARLRRRGLEPVWHERVPPNDGGLALGQLVAAMQDQNRSNDHVPGHSG